MTFLFLLKIREIAACQTLIFKNFDKPIKLTAYDSFTIISYFKFQLHTHQFSVQIIFRFLLIIHNFKKCYAWFFHALRTFWRKKKFHDRMPRKKGSIKVAIAQWTKLNNLIPKIANFCPSTWRNITLISIIKFEKLSTIL